MPTIMDFEGFKIFMYFEDHNPPHFHIVGPDFSVKVAIEDLTILNGNLPRNAAKALEWAAQNRNTLKKKWQEFSED